MKKILIRLAVIAIAATAVLNATVSYFLDVETSSGNMFITDTFGLRVGDDDPTTWNFTRENILPGDNGKEGVGLHNNENMDGELSISFDNLLDEENACWEPEYADESDCDADTNGELGEKLDILAYLDENNNGDYETTDTLIYNGKASGILGGSLSDYLLPSAATEYFMLEWSLDSAVVNNVQSDKVVFDIVFNLNQKEYEDKPILTIGTSSAEAVSGTLVSVPIIATDAFSGIAGMELHIVRTPGLTLLTPPAAYTFDKLPPSAANQVGNEIIITWLDYTGYYPLSFNSGDVLMYLNFEVTDNVPKTVDLSFTSHSIINDNVPNPILTTFENGAVHIGI